MEVSDWVVLQSCPVGIMRFACSVSFYPTDRQKSIRLSPERSGSSRLFFCKTTEIFFYEMEEITGKIFVFIRFGWFEYFTYSTFPNEMLRFNILLISLLIV